jgi:hypothetical protein
MTSQLHPEREFRPCNFPGIAISQPFVSDRILPTAPLLLIKHSEFTWFISDGESAKVVRKSMKQAAVSKPPFQGSSSVSIICRRSVPDFALPFLKSEVNHRIS